MRANELSVNDLMIGDLVIFHDSGYASDGTTWEENRVCRIDSIDGDVRVKWYDESGCEEDWPHVSTVFLSPIPITPEILKKNGFEKVQINGEKQDDIFQCFDGEIIIEVGIYDPNFILIHYRHETPDGINSGVLSSIVKVDGGRFYLHELQHALRLCGIEKEIIM